MSACSPSDEEGMCPVLRYVDFILCLSVCLSVRPSVCLSVCHAVRLQRGVILFYWINGYEISACSPSDEEGICPVLKYEICCIELSQ